MFQTLARVNAAIARVQPELPATAKITAERLTFAAFPILGYSLTSDTVPQTRLWELATYELKPRLNRMSGVSTMAFLVGSDGAVREARLLKSSGHAILDQAAQAALRLCRFTPARKNGEPVAAWQPVQYAWALP